MLLLPYGHLFPNSSSGQLFFVFGTRLNWYSTGRGAWSPRQSQGPCLSCLEFSSRHASWLTLKYPSVWFFGSHCYAPTPGRWVASEVEHTKWSSECWDDKNADWPSLIFSIRIDTRALSQPSVRWPPAPVVHRAPGKGEGGSKQWNWQCWAPLLSLADMLWWVIYVCPAKRAFTIFIPFNETNPYKTDEWLQKIPMEKPRAEMKTTVWVLWSSWG